MKTLMTTIPMIAAHAFRILHESRVGLSWAPAGDLGTDPVMPGPGSRVLHAGAGLASCIKYRSIQICQSCRC